MRCLKRIPRFTPVVAACALYVSSGSAHAAEATYDAANRLRSFTANDAEMRYQYDGAGNLTRICLVVDDDVACEDVIIDERLGLPRVVAVRSSVAGDELYAYGPGGLAATRRSTGDVSLAVLDRIGSVRGAVEPQRVSDRRVYSAWGERRSPVDPGGVRLGYTGEFSPNANHGPWLRTRTYLPQVGRLLQRDSVVGSRMAPQQLHRYTYVTGGNPMKDTDPTGRSICERGRGALPAGWEFDFCGGLGRIRDSFLAGFNDTYSGGYSGRKEGDWVDEMTGPARDRLGGEARDRNPGAVVAGGLGAIAGGFLDALMAPGTGTLMGSYTSGYNPRQLMSAAHAEAMRLLPKLAPRGKAGSHQHVGPFLGVALHIPTGKSYYNFNGGSDDVARKLNPPLADLIQRATAGDEAANNILSGYRYSKGAGTHAEVRALADAMLAHPESPLTDFDVIAVGTGYRKGVRRGQLGPFCPHCFFGVQGTAASSFDLHQGTPKFYQEMNDFGYPPPPHDF